MLKRLGMKTVLKSFGIVSGVQVVLCLVIGLMVGVFSPKLDSLLTIMFYTYTPTIYLISTLGRFRGDSAMVYPILLGIPLGISLYALIVGLAIKHFRKGG